jgi:hypothetical protein
MYIETKKNGENVIITALTNGVLRRSREMAKLYKNIDSNQG